MRHSLYLQLATLLVRADLRREDRVWRAKLRRTVHDLPWDNAFLLRDVGLDTDGRPLGLSEPAAVTADRRVRHLRRVLSSRITT